jgi:ketosteroid isomerase-like protein
VSEKNVELVRRVFASFEGGVDADEFQRRFQGAPIEDFYDPEVELVPASQSLLATGEYRGHEGIRRFFAEFLSTCDELRMEPLEFHEAGDQVVAVFRMRARTHELETVEIWSSLFTLRSGRIVRVVNFASRDGALKAAGVRE